MGSANPIELRDPPAVEYTVIGDSWAAGSGAGGLATRWPPPNPCDQDAGSYAHILQNDTDMGISKLNIQACAGLNAEQVLRCEVGSDSPAPGSECKNVKPEGLGHPGLITVQMGMDSIDVEGLIKACVTSPGDPDGNCDEAKQKSHGLIDSLAKSETILVCLQSAPVHSCEPHTDRIDTDEVREQKTLKAVIEKTGINPKKVFVPDYVAFFNIDNDECVSTRHITPILPPLPTRDVDQSVPLIVTKDNRRDINDIIRHLNSVIAHDVNSAGAVLVPLDLPGGHFDRHRLCDDDTSLFTQFITKEDYRQWIEEGNLFIGRMFRPTVDGYNAIRNKIREAMGLPPKILELPANMHPPPPKVSEDDQGYVPPVN